MKQLNLFSSEEENYPDPQGQSEVSFQLVDDLSEAYKVIDDLSAHPILGVDLETTSLDPHLGRIRLIQIATSPTQVYIFDLFKVEGDKLADRLTALFQNTKKVAHNALFETKWLHSMGVEVDFPVFCSMIADTILQNGRGLSSSLGEVAKRYLNVTLDKSLQVSDWSNPDLSLEQLTYAAKDAAILLPLRESLIPRLVKDKLVRVAEIEFRAISALAHTEYYGLAIDWDGLEKLKLELEQEKDVSHTSLMDLFSTRLEEVGELPLQKNLFGEVTLNINSPQQLLRYFKKLNPNIDSTDRNKLKQFSDPAIDAYLSHKDLITQHRDCEKILKHRHPKTGRLHTHFFQCKARSGRISAADPNILNISHSSGFRSKVVPAPGYTLVCCDFSQIQLRIAAEISNDPAMIEAYVRGDDLHSLTASVILNKPIQEINSLDRQTAKGINFGALFGQSPKGLQKFCKSTYGVEISLQEAQLFHARFFEKYSKFRAWQMRQADRTLDTFSSRPVFTRTMSGRIRWLYKEEQRLTIVVNTPIQGTEADIFKLALGYLHLDLKKYVGKARIVNLPHDEILVECEKALADEVLALMKLDMQKAGEVFLKSVPVVVEGGYGDTWDKAK